MVKQTKSTKKFEKKHLKGVIDRRKEFAKVKQRHQKKDKQKQRNALKQQQQDADSEDDESASGDDMNQDEYFEAALPVPDEPNAKKKKVKDTTGKRKREEEAAAEIPAGSEDQVEDDDELDMAALAENDPEFHKYLKENDPELLHFNEDDDLAELDDLSEEDDERPNKKRKTEEEEEAGAAEVTTAMITKWKKSMVDQHSIRALREVVLAFRAAAHMDDDEEKDYKYIVPSSDIYHEILVTALRDAPAVLTHHLPVKESASGKLRVPTDSSKFKTLSPLIKSHVSSLHHLLGNLSDAATIRMTLQSFEPLLPYLLQFRKFLKQIIKSVASIWSDNTSDEATRITAFLILRRLLTIGDSGIKETVLKSSYENLIKGSRNTTPHTITGINLMKNSAAELWGLDQKVSYTAGFTFIRQLAIHLRTNITKPTKDSYKTIYNWQFIHSLDFWSRVLSMHCASLLEAQNGSPSQLRPLIYPVVQITLGVMRMIPTSTYFPLRFQLMRALLRISQSTGTYIPLSSALLEVLNSAEMKKPAKPSTQRSLDFSTNIRAPVVYLKTRVYQDSIGEQVVELMSEFFVLWAKTIAYPELQLPVTVMLKRWLRTASSKATGNKNAKVNQALLLLVQKSELNARWIEERRNKVSFSPRDRTEVEAFLKDVSWEDTPLGAFVVGQRKLKEERIRVLEQARRDEERRKKNERENGGDEDDAIQTTA